MSLSTPLFIIFGCRFLCRFLCRFYIFRCGFRADISAASPPLCVYLFMLIRARFRTRFYTHFHTRFRAHFYTLASSANKQRFAAILFRYVYYDFFTAYRRTIPLLPVGVKRGCLLQHYSALVKIAFIFFNRPAISSLTIKIHLIFF